MLKRDPYTTKERVLFLSSLALSVLGTIAYFVTASIIMPRLAGAALEPHTQLFYAEHLSTIMMIATPLTLVSSLFFAHKSARLTFVWLSIVLNVSFVALGALAACTPFCRASPIP